jgi:hypothetical protein
MQMRNLKQGQYKVLGMPDTTNTWHPAVKPAIELDFATNKCTIGGTEYNLIRDPSWEC